MSTRAGQTGVCPHCRTGVRFEAASAVFPGPPRQWGTTAHVTIPTGAAMAVEFSGCPVCGRPIVEIASVTFKGTISNGPGVVYPAGAARPLPPEVLTAVPALAADFEEAVAVLPQSRKASAALSRRCLQLILVEAGGAKKRDLADQIDEVLPNLPRYLAENVDAVRHVGNFAAHPMKSSNTGAIVDVEDQEAEWLLDVIEELINFYYVEPAKANVRRDALNKKLSTLGKAPLKQP